VIAVVAGGTVLRLVIEALWIGAAVGVVVAAQWTIRRAARD
jgi:hypothetical protein